MPSSTNPPFAEGLSVEARHYWQLIDSSFEQTQRVYAECFDCARKELTDEQLTQWAKYANELGSMGLGAAPQCAWIRSWPKIVELNGASLFNGLKECITSIFATPNKRAIEAIITQTARNLHRVDAYADRLERLTGWFNSVVWLALSTSISVHGRELTHPSQALIPFIRNSEQPIALLEPQALQTWLENGVHIFEKRPDRLAEYCSLKSSEGVAFLAQLRKGDSLDSCLKQLMLVCRGLMKKDSDFVAIPTYNLDEYSEHLARPFYEDDGIRLPDRYEAMGEVAPAKRYLLAAMHIYFHQQYSTSILADNLSPLQRLAIEVFEDARIDYLMGQRFQGLKKYLLSLHPIPSEHYLTTEHKQSLVRIRLALVSRAILDDTFKIEDAVIEEFAERLRVLCHDDKANTERVRDLAIAFIAKTRQQQDQSKDVIFDNTRVSYRDDNRNLWRFIEAGDEEDLFEPPPNDPNQIDEQLFTQEYPEWDYQLKKFRPKWVSLYEQLQPSGSSQFVDDILVRNRDLIKRLQQIFELIRPHERERIRFQVDGDMMDVDLATQALIDLKTGVTPSERIDESIRHDGRTIAVYVLLDLSESLNDSIGQRTMLGLTQEAVSLLAWSISQLGDEFAIGGFASDTRHRVYFQHIKGFSESLDDTVKGRIGTLKAGFSTRMGTAVRHASDILSKRGSDTKLLLIITDGEPSDIDVHDEQYLIEDARHSVFETEDKGIKPYCISVDPNADSYIHRIFGSKVAVIDAVERLPERVTEIFLKLTR